MIIRVLLDKVRIPQRKLLGIQMCASVVKTDFLKKDFVLWRM